MTAGALWKRRMIVDLGSADPPARYEYPPWGVAFEVKLDTTPQANTAQIKLWNLSRATILKLTRGLRVKLAAGYEADSVGDIFWGTLDHEETVWDGPDKVTTLHCNDGKTTTLAARVNESWKPGTPASTVVEDLFNAAGIDPREVEDGGWVYEKGFTADSGTPVGDHLDAIMGDVASHAKEPWEWFTFFGRGYFRPRRRSHAPQTMKAISPESGLIGEPQPVRKATEDVAGGEAEPVQWQIQTVLLWQLEPGARFKLKSRRFKESEFKILRITHVGTMDGRFESNVLADPITVQVTGGGGGGPEDEPD